MKMVGGGRMRNVNSVYQRTHPAVLAVDEEQSERRRRRRRRGQQQPQEVAVSFLSA
jgi:hypothetical protein